MDVGSESGDGAAPLPPNLLPGESKEALPGHVENSSLQAGLAAKVQHDRPARPYISYLQTGSCQTRGNFAACSCSTEIRAMTRGLLSCWQLEVAGGNSQGMALSDGGVSPAPWEQRCAVLLGELRTSGKEESSVSFVLISFSMFGPAVFAHGKCFDRFLLWVLFGLFFFFCSPSSFSQL